MRGVEHHGCIARRAHAGQRAKIDHEIAVAEERATLGGRDFGRTRASCIGEPLPNLGGGTAHRLGVHPLPLLDVHRPPSRACGDQQIRLARQERRDLQHVGDLRGRCTLIGQMHVGEHGQPRRGAHAIERGESLVQPGTAKRPGVRAVGLVEARLEDDAARDALREPREMLRDSQVEAVVLEHARARDEEQRITPEARSRHDGDALTSFGAATDAARRLALAAAAMKPAKSGCGRVGRDCSSGWNWQPTNHG